MSTKRRVNGPKRRGQTVKAQSDAGLAEVAPATSRLWRKHHLSYDQTKYVVERARRALGVEPRTRRRTVQRLDYPEVERLIRSAYRDSSAYGVMIKTLFLTGARVNEFVHIRVEDLHLDDESPQIYLTHAKREACRYVPVLPALAQELRTHLQGRRQGYLFERNRHTLYSVRTVHAVVERSPGRRASPSASTRICCATRLPPFCSTRAWCPSTNGGRLVELPSEPSA